jgi:fumarate reductase subunit D
MHAFAAHWGGKIALATVVFLSLWSAAHRMRITAYDLGLRADALVAALLYAATLACTGAAIYQLARI